MSVSHNDISILRSLAEQVAEIGSLPVQKQTAQEWRRLNSLKKGRPLIWINELPWHEMNVNDEMTLCCKDSFCRGIEWNLRATIYQWQHLRGDMVVEPIYYSPLVIHDSGFGIIETGDHIAQSDNGGIFSTGYKPQINDEKDIAKIKDPVVTHDAEASERNYQSLSEIFGDILPVQKCGIVHMWFSPWDELIRWWGVQEALMDIAMRPELVHMAMDRLTNAFLARLRQWEELNLLSLTPGNYRVGSGGPGYCDEIPAPDFDANHVRTIDQWGCATAQIFSSVSPAMHEEFALHYERRWLSKFGINYYGCCEPLHDKLDVLTSIPNLRKISMSPWADLDKAAPKMAGKYVVSYKPNPAIFATDIYDPTQAHRELTDALKKTEGCVVEIIMKDISATRNDPHRVWQWAQMAMDVAGEMGG
jgi:hypothetical protein